MNETPKEKYSEYFLVVDDMMFNSRIMSQFLNRLGYGTVVCRNGQLAMESLEAGQQPVIGVFSDLMMPVMDGVDLLKAVRNHEKFKHLPFFAVTAVDQNPEFLRKLGDIGLTDFIIKPASFEKVKDIIDKFFKNKNKIA